MGIAQNALLGAGAAVGVAANKFATGMQGISAANDGQKAKMMRKKARQNMMDKREADREAKKKTAAAATQNNPAARATVREIMGGR